MTQHVELDHEDILHQGFTDPIQELLGAAAPNFRLSVKNDTTVEVAAGTDNSQVSIAINGKYRWRTSGTTAALPGGLPNGAHPVFVTASANDFGGAPSDIDKDTDYSFGLQVKPTGETPSTTHWRQVGIVTVASEKIVGIEQTVASVSGAQIASGALSGNGDITWTRDSSGAWVPQLKADSVAASEIGTLPYCRVRKTTATSIPHATETALTFPTEVYDTDSMHSTSSQTGRITATTTGLYVFTLTLAWELGGATSSVLRAMLRLNGNKAAIIGSDTRFFMATSVPITQGVSTIYRLEAGDYVDVAVLQDSGGAARELVGSTGNGQDFSAAWLSD